MAQALEKAAQVCCDTFDQVVTMFQDANDGKPIAIDDAETTVDQLLASLDEDPAALLSLVRLKSHNDYACMHSVAVCALMASLAQSLNLSPADRRRAALAGLLHDIGKAFIPARILKKPGRLSSDEYAEVRSHPERGFASLQTTEGIEADVQDVALHHHERPDGKGYPHGLAGDELGLLARMGAICDVYDAVTSNRPYKDAWDPAEALTQMHTWSAEGQFDAAVMRAFQTCLGRYPIGSLVRLTSGQLAVVNARPSSEQGSVTVFYCTQSNALISPKVVHLGLGGATIQGQESNAVWRFADLDSLWAGEFCRGSLASRKSIASFA
jgi:putative nucleotidyltransferase with HDIG domain